MKNDTFLSARDMFFVEFLNSTKDNKNRQLYNLLRQESKKSGFLPFFVYSLISDVFFKKISENNDKENKKVLFLEKENYQEKIINESIDLSNSKYLIALHESFKELLRSPEFTLNEKLNLELLINDLSKLKKEDFLKTLIDYLNKEWFHQNDFSFKSLNINLEKIEEKIKRSSYEGLTIKKLLPIMSSYNVPKVYNA